MVLGKLQVPGRPTIWITVGQGPTALAIGAGGGCLDIFTLIYPFSPLSPSLWETARYRLKYCLKGPLNPKPTNQGSIQPSEKLRDGRHYLSYRKNSKIWDTSNNCHNCPKNRTFDVTLHLCTQKMLMEWQTAQTLIRLLLQKQSDLGLHCLLRPICPNT